MNTLGGGDGAPGPSHLRNWGCVQCRERERRGGKGVPCDGQRPCQRCFLLGEADLCRDEEEPPAGPHDGATSAAMVHADAEDGPDADEEDGPDVEDGPDMEDGPDADMEDNNADALFAPAPDAGGACWACDRTDVELKPSYRRPDPAKFPETAKRLCYGCVKGFDSIFTSQPPDLRERRSCQSVLDLLRRHRHVTTGGRGGIRAVLANQFRCHDHMVRGDRRTLAELRQSKQHFVSYFAYWDQETGEAVLILVRYKCGRSRTDLDHRNLWLKAKKKALLNASVAQNAADIDPTFYPPDLVQRIGFADRSSGPSPPSSDPSSALRAACPSACPKGGSTRWARRDEKGRREGPRRRREDAGGVGREQAEPPRPAPRHPSPRRPLGPRRRPPRRGLDPPSCHVQLPTLLSELPRSTPCSRGARRSSGRVGRRRVALAERFASLQHDAVAAAYAGEVRALEEARGKLEETEHARAELEGVRAKQVELDGPLGLPRSAAEGVLAACGEAERTLASRAAGMDAEAAVNKRQLASAERTAVLAGALMTRAA
ncbi:hypothetical protein DFJ74DRAFT_729916 [Hyaloraphidium curvatum]|nr:hypothetical protein DFJ74DRAFT_729916 [Hyaloraphidium curvatum]